MTTLDPRLFFPASEYGEVLDVVSHSGLSGAKSFAVKTAKGDFMLRVQSDDRARWAKTVRMQRLAAEHGIAPAIVAVDEERAASISVRVSGVPFTNVAMDPAVRPRAMASLVATLAKLHALPVDEGADARFDRRGLAVELWAAQAARPGFPGWARPLGERLTRARSVLAPDPRVVLGHGDLHPMNILWDGTRVWLLDWERAGVSHPFMDLATLSNFMILPDEAGLGLLAGELGAAVGAADRAIFVAARTYSRIVYGTVFTSLAANLETAAVAVAQRNDAPDLATCYRRMTDGTLSPATPEGCATIGSAFYLQELAAEKGS